MKCWTDLKNVEKWHFPDLPQKKTISGCEKWQSFGMLEPQPSKLLAYCPGEAQISLAQQWIVQSMPSTYRNDMSDMLLQRIQFWT